MKTERFLSLPLEKQHIIIDAAMTLFGAVGYKKASVADIAVKAGISKAMVFYYFGSKKALYLYLVEFAGDTIKREIDRQFDKSVTDFFDKIRLGADIKISALRKFPGLIAFLSNMYFETDKEVVSEIKRFIADGEGYGNAFVIENIDRRKWMDDVDPELVLEILTNYTEGYLSKMPFRTAEDMDMLMTRFGLCLDLMKKHFYKDEFSRGV